jgi:hypothetical protein
MNFLKSKRARVSAIVGGFVGIIGIALAAFLITSEISGNVTFDDANVDYSVAVSSPTSTGGMVCNVDNDERNITVSPVVKRFTSPGQTSEVRDQSCVVRIAVTNDGDVPLRVAGNGTALLAPQNGIAVTNPTANPGNGSVPVGGTAVYTVTLVPGPNTTAGPITGQLQFEEAAA